MGISDRLLGKKNVNGNPRIEAVHPSAALPGGEVRITGRYRPAATGTAASTRALRRT